mgnify:CR=1 FL=1
MKDIKKDMDILVQQSNFVDVFWDNMKKKWICSRKNWRRICHLSSVLFRTNLSKTLGEQYHYENIEDRLTDKRNTATRN